MKNKSNYFYITPRNGIDVEVFTKDDKLPANNHYKTFRDARFALERNRVLEELRKYSYDFRYKGNMGEKFYIVYDEILSTITIKYTYDYLGPIVYFKSFKAAKAAIRAVGYTRLVKYYFGRF